VVGYRLKKPDGVTGAASCSRCPSFFNVLTCSRASSNVCPLLAAGEPGVHCILDTSAGSLRL
jgi:hypothetical protein